MANLFKKAAVCTDIHFGLKSNSQTHNDDCLNFIKWFIETAKAEVSKKAEEKAKAEQAEMDKVLNEKYGNAKTTPSGLRYITELEGNGASPIATSNVTVHYSGYLLNGKKFDSSVDRGQPATFPLNQVIAGWTEGLQLMKKGGKTKSDKWIKEAIGKPGALRESLGVKKGEKIPAKKLAAAAKKPGKMGKRARLAETLKGLKK